MAILGMQIAGQYGDEIRALVFSAVHLAALFVHTDGP
jgi:hypothetical protein